MKLLKFQHLTLPMILLVAVNQLPGLYYRPLWAMIFCAVVIGYRSYLHFTQKSMPPKWVMLVLQVLSAVLIWQHYFSFFGDEAAGTFLSLLCCLKLYELNVKRDFFVATMLCFLVLMSFLLLDQSLILTAFLLFDATLLLTFLFALEDDRQSWRGWREAIKPGLILTFKAIPLMILIFVLFPRFSTGFGAGTNPNGKTGISDSLKPGSVSSLMTSDELVFRATFLDGNIPPRQNLYWRGAILDQSHGLDWDRHSSEASSRVAQNMGGQDIEIYLEPGFEKFLFTLETTYTVSFPSDPTTSRIALRPGRIFELNQPLQSRQRYFLHNSLERTTEPENLSRYLETDDEVSKPLKVFLEKVKGKTPRATVRQILNHFRSGGYAYSLSPPPAKSMDQFLFKTKEGFCEHFAGAMATLLRHLNIPSRVVVGFQGGTPSFLDNYLSVRAHDAHAWVEYFDGETNRWRRVDPTAEVEPKRIIMGSESYLTQNESWLGFFGKDWNTVYFKSRALLDEVDARWTGFLIGFDLGRQKELLARLGMEGVMYRALPVFLILAIVLALSLIYFFEAQKKESLSDEDLLYRQLLNELKRRHLVKEKTEGPKAYFERLRQAFPEVANEIEPTLTHLTEIRYGRTRLEPTDRQRLKLQIRRIKKLSIKSATR